MEFLKQIHQESNGQYSWMRFSSTVGLLLGATLTVHQILTGADHTLLITMWMTAAMGTKTLQKFAEDKKGAKK